MAQADTLCLSPEIGWVVRERTSDRVEYTSDSDVDEVFGHAYTYLQRQRRLT